MCSSTNTRTVDDKLPSTRFAASERDERQYTAADAGLVNNTAAAAKYDVRELKAPDRRPGPSLYRLSSGSL